MSNIATLISGGVDSSVVVHLLKESGITPTLFYLQIGQHDDFLDCSSEDDIELIRIIAKRYGCELNILDLHQDYWDRVVSYTINKVKQGLTPNPDVMCNKLIKFGVFEEKAGRDFDQTATGHYADTIVKDNKTYLITAKDPLKDQTDFLAQINQLQVSKLIFPLGKYPKSAVREMAENANLPTAKRHDSQGICFLGKINYNDFIRRYLGEKKGPIVEFETGKILGTHRGYWFHTVGQRKGLGLSGGPWYVIKKSVEANIIYVSMGYNVATQYGKLFQLRDFNFITEEMWTNANAPVDITFKIRHTPEFTKGTIERTPKGYLIKSKDKLQGIAAGQFGVIYDDKSKVCIGSGEII